MKEQGGYTVVEVALAIGVSAALVFLLTGLMVTLGQQRFQDSMVTARTYLQSQYEEVRSIINPRLDDGSSLCSSDNDNPNSTTAGNSKCYFIGRMVKFSGENLEKYFIVAIPQSNEWPKINQKNGIIGDTADANLRSNDVHLKVLGAGSFKESNAATEPQHKSLSNGNEVRGVWSWNNNNITGGIDSVVILRSPIDNSVLTYTFDSNNADIIDGSGRLNMSNPGVKLSDWAMVAIKNGGAGHDGGAICFEGNASSSTAVTSHLPVNNGDNGDDLPTLDWNNLGGSNLNINKLKAICEK